MEKKNTVFYKCERCGNLFGLMKGNIDNILCCGERMHLLKTNDYCENEEICKPTYKKIGKKVFAKVEGPNKEKHLIEWIAQISDNQTTRVRIYENQEPKAVFKYIPNSIIYSYCNKHGLGKTEVK